MKPLPATLIARAAVSGLLSGRAYALALTHHEDAGLLLQAALGLAVTTLGIAWHNRGALA